MTDIFRSTPMTVRPEWIDHNGHLNMAYYSVLFDQGVDQVWQTLGLGPDYVKARGMTTFLAEFHIQYMRELHEGDQVVATYQVLDHDEKRIHSYQELYHADGWLAAGSESLHLSIDQSGPRVAAFPDDIAARIEALAAAHAGLARPKGVGRVIGIRRP